MATAEQYADWIVKNKDKKGTPEFEKVSAAYKLAKQGGQAAAAPAAAKPAAAPEQELSGWEKAYNVGKGALSGLSETAESLSPAAWMKNLLPIEKKEGASGFGGFLDYKLGKPQAVRTAEGLVKAVSSPLETAGEAVSGAMDFAGSVLSPQTKEDYQKIGRALEVGTELVAGGIAGARGLFGKAAGEAETGLGKIGEQLSEKEKLLRQQVDAEREAMNARRTSAARDDLSRRAELNRRKEYLESRAHEIEQRREQARTALDERRQKGMEPIRQRLTTMLEEAKNADKLHLEQADAAESAALEKSRIEHEQAVNAANTLASEQAKNLPRAEVARLRRYVDNYVSGINSDAAGAESLLPKADAVGGRLERGGSLNSRIRTSIMDAFDKALTKKRQSPAFVKYGNRWEELTKEGRYWGREESGINLIKDFKAILRVEPTESESLVSRYQRNTAKNIIDALEVEPTDVAKGTTATHPVPVSIDIVDSELRNLRWKQHRLAEAGRYGEAKQLGQFADRIQKSIEDFVGKEYFPNEMYAADAADYNLFGSKLGKDLVGQKPVKYLKDVADFNTPMEDMEKKAFANTASIRRYRELLKNDETFHEHVMQHVSNELHGKSSEKVLEWLGKSEWVDNINLPEVRNSVLHYAEALSARERNTEVMSKVAKKLRESVEKNTAEIESRLSEIEKTKAAALKRAESERAALERAAKVERQRAEARAPRVVQQERRAARGLYQTEKEALEESLRPEKEALEAANMERAGLAREQRQLGRQVQQERGERSIRREERRISEAEIKQSIEQKTKLANGIEKLVMGQTPKRAAAYFNRIRGRMVSSGVMTEAEANELGNLLSENVSRQSAAAHRRAIRKWIGNWVIKPAAITLGAGGAYKAISGFPGRD